MALVIEKFDHISTLKATVLFSQDGRGNLFYLLPIKTSIYSYMSCMVAIYLDHLQTLVMVLYAPFTLYKPPLDQDDLDALDAVKIEFNGNMVLFIFWMCLGQIQET